MLKPVVTLEASMSAAAVIERLTLQGFWSDANHPLVRARLQPLSERSGRSVAEVAKALAQDARGYGAAIRRQYGTRVMWYARELREVLERCAAAVPGRVLDDVLELQASGAQTTIRFQPGGEAVLASGVVMDGGVPVAVSLAPEYRESPLRVVPGQDTLRSIDRGSISAPSGEVPPSHAAASEAARDKPAWPRIESPAFVPALKPFAVVVGFGASPQSDVAGGPVTLKKTAGVDVIEVSVHLLSGAGIEAPNGWSRAMSVPVHDMQSSQVSFELVGTEPVDPKIPYLTLLEVRYVIDGVVCGTAARPLVITHSSADAVPPTLAAGDDWNSAARTGPMTLVAEDEAPDLTIEIIKPDGNAASGRYACQIYSPHVIAAPRGPFPLDLSQDAKTFAKSIVDEVRLLARSPLLDTTLESIGRLVAQRLPVPVLDAVREVAAKTASAPPAVLIVSAEPYVPWELAWMEPPIDATRPCYLGAQALVGRWLRDSGESVSPRATAVKPRPAIHPNAALSIRNMAVIAAWYKAASGFLRLRMAELEVKAIADRCGCLALDASAQSMQQLLGRRLERIGGVDAVHFAGHGDFDPAKPEGSALFLEDGTPLRSTLFRAAKYGGDQQPLMFLNACMLGIGGELLGDMAGFPGNSLRGGFGGVIGALWEVDDSIAHDFALEFWQQALPPAPAQGKPIGAILRDLRAKYRPDAMPAPVSTYLAYVYYGHPRLRLRRATA
jgi:hypothetical protein